MQKIVKLLSTALLFGWIINLSSCYYDVEEELYPSNSCQTEEVTYSMDILPLLEDNCYGCHNAASAQGGITLEGYQALGTYINSGQLLGALKHETGFSPMPQGQPMLEECSIEKLQAWINAGALEN